MPNSYWNKNFTMSFFDSNDKITVKKSSGDDWSHLSMLTNGHANGEITIRSKAMVEQLHFTLGQMLEDDK